MDIVCRKHDCGHNNCSCCEAREINIGNNLDCETFTMEKREHKNLCTGKQNMFELGEELTKYKSDKNTKIGCNATSCLFNDNCKCTSNGISVINRDTNLAQEKCDECNCNENCQNENTKSEYSCSCCGTYIKK